MKTKHTKGKWRAISSYNDQKVLVTNEKNYLLAHCYAHVRETGNQPLSLEEAEANAKLISAAPELLEALNNLVNSCEYHGKRRIPDMKHIADAIEAIKKATE